MKEEIEERNEGKGSQGRNVCPLHSIACSFISSFPLTFPAIGRLKFQPGDSPGAEPTLHQADIMWCFNLTMKKGKDHPDDMIITHQYILQLLDLVFFFPCNEVVLQINTTHFGHIFWA